MGQKFKDDVIGSLSHSLGTITLQSSRLTVGGQQYTTGVLQLTLPSLTANTLYMLYVTVTAGVASLVQSTNVNSVGPAGYTAWKLVGAYYSNGLSSVSFGAFVSIDGKPISGEVIQAPLTIFGGGSNPTKPVGNPDFARFERDGAFMLYRYSYAATGAGSGGSGAWLWPTPTNTSIDIVKATSLVSGNSNSDILGTGRWGNAGIAYGGHCYISSSTRIGIASWQDGGALIVSMGSSANVVSTSAFYGGFDVRIPIVGWTDTPLKDL